MQGQGLRLSRNVLAAFGLALTVFAFAPDASAQAQDRNMLRLQDQLRDCRGDGCVPIREEMMTRMRQRLDNCAGGQCDQIRERLRLHEQVQDCHGAGGRNCRELRMHEREQVRPRYHYGDRDGMGYGMGGGMGRGMGGGMGGGMGRGN